MSKSLQLCRLTVATRLLCAWDSPGKNTGVGCHALLQGIFPTQGSIPGLLHCRWILHHLSHQGSLVGWIHSIKSPFLLGRNPTGCVVGSSTALLTPWPQGASLIAQSVRIRLQCRRPGFNSWIRKIPWRREWQPTPVFFPGESNEQRSLVGYSP